MSPASLEPGLSHAETRSHSRRYAGIASTLAAKGGTDTAQMLVCSKMLQTVNQCLVMYGAWITRSDTRAGVDVFRKSWNTLQVLVCSSQGFLTSEVILIDRDLTFWVRLACIMIACDVYLCRVADPPRAVASSCFPQAAGCCPKLCPIQ